MARIKNWTKATKEELWRCWRQQFTWDDEAIGQAVWIANRLVKDRALSTRKQFYALKDEFIKQYGCNGRKARLEADKCYACNGDGCGRCGFSGEFRSRWLYVHEFDICGQRYCFHSYLEPKVLLEGAGEDLEKYGGTFTEEEFEALGLPLSGLLRILRFVAVERWGLTFFKGMYYSGSGNPF